MSLKRIAPVLLFAFAASPTRADLPAVRLDLLTPPGGAAGTTIDVAVQGADMEEVKTLLFDHPGLKATFVKERHFRVAIAADVPAGTYDARLVGRFGVSNPRLFSVTHGLTDIAEKEPNDEPETAQKIAVNSAVNGTSDANRDDVFRFTAKKGQRLVVECQAGKLDSTMDATLAVTDVAGKPIVANGDYFGRDPLVDFVAPADGDYFATVHDLSYRGGQPYRLIVTDRPQIENVFPRAVQAGRPVELSVFGRNLGRVARPSPWRIFDLPLDELKTAVTPPEDVLTFGAYRFLDHPTDHSVLPTAATCTLTGWQPRLKLGDTQVNGPPLLLTDTPVTLETEPNDTQETAQAIMLPAVVSGRFDRARDADWYSFETSEAGAYSFEVYCERIGGRADPYLVVVDAKGNRLAELDDFGHRLNAFDGHLRDPSGMVHLAAKSKYRVLVQDRYRRGGGRYQYVLSIRKPVPDFYVAAIHSQNPGPAGTTVWRGGAAYLDVIIHQSGGFNGPITLTAKDLPPWLHAAPTIIANNSHGTFVLWADENAPAETATVKLIARGKQGERTLEREVRPYTRVWTDPSQGSSRPTRELIVAVRESAPFSLRFTLDKVEVEAGKKIDLKLLLERRGFKSKVSVLPLMLPNIVRLSNTEIAAESNVIALTVEVPPGTPPGEHTLTVLGQAQVPYSKDPRATQRPNTLVSLPSRPLNIVVIGPKK
ncbi:MAG: PPC domain-containing protein [Planctomycetes bacterium]|nr:PPC domain-containing protein [Planctomycetota bacterium]